MAIEEITLGSVESALDAERRTPSKQGNAGRSDQPLTSRYRKLLQARSRFAWSRRAQLRRDEKFNVNSRSLVKELAQHCAGSVADRNDRQRVRTDIYASVIGLLDVASRDIRRRQERSTTFFRYGLALGVLGLCSLIFAGFAGFPAL